MAKEKNVHKKKLCAKEPTCKINTRKQYCKKSDSKHKNDLKFFEALDVQYV